MLKWCDTCSKKERHLVRLDWWGYLIHKIKGHVVMGAEAWEFIYHPELRRGAHAYDS